MLLLTSIGLLAGYGPNLPSAPHAPLGTSWGTVSQLSAHLPRVASEAPLVAPVLSSDGATASVIGLTWTGGPGFWYNDYYLYESTSSSGPWTQIGSTYTTSTSYFLYGFGPNETWYFYVHDVYASGSIDSSTLSVTTTAAPLLSMGSSTTTTVTLDWTNYGYYTSLVGFENYEIMDSINSGAWTSVTNISSEATTTYTVTGIPAGGSGSFYIIVWDDCPACTTDYSSPSDSNIVGASTVIPPSVTISAGATSIDVGQNDSFTATPSGGKAPFSFAWTFGDGSTASASVVSHSYSSSGSKTVSVVVTDSVGERTSEALAVTVSPAPSVVASVNHAAASPGTSLSFTAAASGGPGTFTSYQWSFGDSTGGSGITASHSYTSTGSFTASVLVTDANGGTAGGTVSVTIAKLSVTMGASSAAVNVSQVVTFTASASGGGGAPFTYSWSFGDGTTGTGATTTHAYSAAGTDVPSVTVTDSLGATNSTKGATITVQATPSGGGNGGGSGSALSGSSLSGALPYIIVAVLALVAVVVVVVLLARRKGPQAMVTSGAPAPPPTPPQAPGPGPR
jgi:chitodextrinase